MGDLATKSPLNSLVTSWFSKRTDLKPPFPAPYGLVYSDLQLISLQYHHSHAHAALQPHWPFLWACGWGSMVQAPSPLFLPAGFLGLRQLSQAVLRSGHPAHTEVRMETVGLSPELARAPATDPWAAPAEAPPVGP